MAIILSLPDELLAPILHDSVPQDCAHRVAPLALVCRRFHRITTPLLYRDIDIQCNGACGPHRDVRRTKLLHHTFRSNQSLRQHCQSLVIKFGPNSWDSMEPIDGDDSTPNLAYIAVDFVKWLYNTAELRISLVSFYDDTWYETFRTSTPSDLSVLYSQAPKSLTRLKHLQIGQENVPMHLPTLFGSLECLDSSACLRILDLTGVSQIGTEQDWKRLKAKAGTAPFTELKLRHFTQSATALEALVMWPVRLEAFHFSMPRSDYYSGDFALTRYDLGIMKTILSHQKASLSHINIHELLTKSGVEDFNLSGFHQLHTLCMSRDLTGIDTSDVANLLAPNLLIFRWDMRLEDQQCCRGLDGFSQPQEEWIRAFAKSSMERKTSLKQIQINFYPESWFRADIDKDYQYPWDRMERLAGEFEPHGISVVYNPPNITKEEFQSTKEKCLNFRAFFAGRGTTW
ncbi:unnamed protein product [Clonostachys rhizophaga]|uniref:F-box domain-containing protein n=1 Tax=Clonostachys rhizophaga TaxID=160324 RepID=A0A9N9YMS0_9HYPO|nr:unnamed protein product [Clonostachys rhizophaga]